jgi:hypothetical protein
MGPMIIEQGDPRVLTEVFAQQQFGVTLMQERSMKEQRPGMALVHECPEMQQ